MEASEISQLMKAHSFATAKKILFGIGVTAKTGEEAKPTHATKALIVTDHNIVNTGLLGKATKSLEDVNIAYEIWEGAEPEPSVENAQAVVDKVRENIR